MSRSTRPFAGRLNAGQPTVVQVTVEQGIETAADRRLKPGPVTRIRDATLIDGCA